MPIELTPEQIAAIKQHAERAYPDECCGFLLGRSSGGTKRVLSVSPSENVCEAAQRAHRFSISPKEFLATDKNARAEGMEILGFYHSHPDGETRPSQYDAERG